MMTLIGIRREDKNIWEKRVPLIPEDAGELVRNHSLEIWIQPSPLRVFPDSDFERQGVIIREDLSPCPIVLAVKEIPISLIKKGKTYLFFSHTIKGQAHNMPMLRRLKDFECTLIDYEKVVDESGRRLLFFGRQAGQAGMLDTLWSFGQKCKIEGFENPFSDLKQAYQYGSLAEAERDIQRAGQEIREKGLPPSLSPFVCGFTGYGNVSQGAQSVFDNLSCREITPDQLPELHPERKDSSSPIYKVVFKEEHMVRPVSPGTEFDLCDYYNNPERYTPVFDSYLPHLSMVVNCIYWEPQYPRLITRKNLKALWGSESPHLKVIGDLSCDIEGSVEITVKATEPDNPVFIYDPKNDSISDGFEGNGVVVMSVDNLPAEIPIESSAFFSNALKSFIPAIAGDDFTAEFSETNLPGPIKNAVILYKGEFTPEYKYMESYI